MVTTKRGQDEWRAVQLWRRPTSIAALKRQLLIFHAITSNTDLQLVCAGPEQAQQVFQEAREIAELFGGEDE